jgi:hypothetical protein
MCCCCLGLHSILALTRLPLLLPLQVEAARGPTPFAPAPAPAVKEAPPAPAAKAAAPAPAVKEAPAPAVKPAAPAAAQVQPAAPPPAKEQPAAQSVSPRLRGNLGEYHCLPVATLSGLCFLLFNPSRITQIS